MTTKRVADLTLDELRDLIRQEFADLTQIKTDKRPDDNLLYSRFSDFPVDDLGPWRGHSSLRRDDT